MAKTEDSPFDEIIETRIAARSCEQEGHYLESSVGKKRDFRTVQYCQMCTASACVMECKRKGRAFLARPQHLR